MTDKRSCIFEHFNDHNVTTSRYVCHHYPVYEFTHITDNNSELKYYIRTKDGSIMFIDSLSFSSDVVKRESDKYYYYGRFFKSIEHIAISANMTVKEIEDRVANPIFKNFKKSDDVENIKGFSYYIIHKDGSVYSNKSRKWLKIRQPRLAGRLRDVGIVSDKDCKRHTINISTLVANAFLEKTESDIINDRNFVHHKDGDVFNDKLENLVWASRQEISSATFKKTGRCSKYVSINDIVYNSISEASRVLNIPASTIRYRVNNPSQSYSNYKLL